MFIVRIALARATTFVAFALQILIFATFATLYVVPVVFSLVHRRAPCAEGAGSPLPHPTA